MRLCTFSINGAARLGAVIGDSVIDPAPDDQGPEKANDRRHDGDE